MEGRGACYGEDEEEALTLFHVEFSVGLVSGEGGGGWLGLVTSLRLELVG